ncbi:MAG: RidA family protein [Gammaproteobacteria bacterium]|nr:RidA family protein [Gammaproteobacteria bacterium]
MSIDERFSELGLTLPQPMQTASLPFQLTRFDGQILYLSGHVPTNLDGSVAKPLGKVGAELTPEQAYEAARKVTLGMFASIHQAVGSLDRVEAWLKVFGMVNVAPGFKAIPPVINGCSDLILEVFGPEIGAHTRSAVGMAELPFGVPVEIEAQVRIRL